MANFHNFVFVILFLVYNVSGQADTEAWIGLKNVDIFSLYLLPAGKERNSFLYISRVFHNNTWIPSKLRVDHRLTAVITENGEEHLFREFQVLRRVNPAKYFRWVKLDGSLPANAVAADTEKSNGLYFCRSEYQEFTIVGRYSSDNPGNCYIAFDGKEIVLTLKDGIEILVESPILDEPSSSIRMSSGITPFLFAIGVGVINFYKFYYGN